MRNNTTTALSALKARSPTLSTICTTIITTTSLAAASASSSSSATTSGSSRYENQKRRDWNTFGQYLKNHRPPLSLFWCSGAHVLEFLLYLDQFGKTKVHTPICPFYGHPNPLAPCPRPLQQAWGSLNVLIGHLHEVRDLQSKARWISYENNSTHSL